MLLAEEDLKITEFEKSISDSIRDSIRKSINDGIWGTIDGYIVRFIWTTIELPGNNSIQWSVKSSIDRRF